MGHVTVEVDQQALLAEAAQIAEEAPAPAPIGDVSAPAEAPAPAPAMDPAARAADVQPAVRFLIAQVCSVAAPGWDITREESDSVADAASLVMAYWIPDNAIQPKYVALMSLAGALWSVAAARRDDAGNWKPLRKRPLPSAAAPSAQATPPANSLAI